MAENNAEPTPPRVLIIEDNPIARQSLARLLELQGYAAETAGTLAVGAAKLDGQAAVVLDLELPDGLGTELIQLIRREHPHIRVMVLSGAGPALLDEASRLGADHVMPKPVEVPLLLAWLRGETG